MFTYRSGRHYRINCDAILVKPIGADIDFSIVPYDGIKIEIGAAEHPVSYTHLLTALVEAYQTGVIPQGVAQEL